MLASKADELLAISEELIGSIKYESHSKWGHCLPYKQWRESYRGQTGHRDYGRRSPSQPYRWHDYPTARPNLNPGLKNVQTAMGGASEATPLKNLPKRFIL